MVATKPIRLILVADTHLGFDYPLRPRSERRRRGQDFFDNFARTLDFAVNTQADLVVHGGDLFFRSKIPPGITDLAYAMLLEYAESGLHFFIVPGNHERSQLPQSLLTGHPNIRIFDRPQTFEINLSGINVALSGFPNQRENVRNDFLHLLSQTGWQQSMADIRLLCLHQAVEGAQVGPKNFTFRTGHDIIQMRDIPVNFTAVLAGHIHRRQILKRIDAANKKTVPVIYPGSIERTSFAEKNEPKGFYEILFNPGETGVWQVKNLNFHPVPTRPMIEIFINSEFSKYNFQQKLKSNIAGLSPDSIVKLKLDIGVSPEVKKLCMNKALREIFPASMNFELSREFFVDFKSV